MESGKRFGFSVAEKSKIWSRWKAGESLHEIGRAFDKPHSSIRCLLLSRGGIRPVAKLLQINFRPVLRPPPEPAAFIRHNRHKSFRCGGSRRPIDARTPALRTEAP